MENQMDDILLIFVKNLRKYRKQRGYTQEKLAELCGKSLSFIGDMENSRKIPSLKTLQILANALEVRSYQLLLSEDDQRENYHENFFLSLKDKMTPELFQAIEECLRDNEK